MKATHPWVVGIVLLSVFVGTGCRVVSRPDVIVTLDAMNAGVYPTVEVHVIGVNNDAEFRRLNQVDLSTNYNWVREGQNARTYVMKFDNDSEHTQTLKANDPVWKTWDGPKQLFIIASFPPADSPDGGRDGAADPRRLVLPLKWNSWVGKDIPISIQQTGLVCQEGYKPWNPF